MLSSFQSHQYTQHHFCFSEQGNQSRVILSQLSIDRNDLDCIFDHLLSQFILERQIFPCCFPPFQSYIIQLLKEQVNRYIFFNDYIIILCLIGNKKMQRGDSFKRKRINTQKALEVIKRHEVEQSRVNFHQLLNKLDEDYIKYTSHKMMQLDKTYKLSLNNHHQEFYALDMQQCMFPIRVFLKNLRNTGTFYIGYDQKYPGVSKMVSSHVYQNETSVKSKNYDMKVTLNKDLLIILKNKGNQKITDSQMLILDFRVEFLGFVRDQRFLTEMKSTIKPSARQKVFSKNEQLNEILVRAKTQTNEINFKQFIKTKHPIKLQTITKDIKLEQFKVFGDLRHQSKLNLEQITKMDFNINKPDKNSSSIAIGPLKNKSQSLIALKHKNPQTFPQKQNNISSEINWKIEQTRRNKELLQFYKQKDKLMRQKASQGKRLIERYQKIYKEESVMKRSLNKELSIIIYSLIFLHKTFATFQSGKKKMEMVFRAQYLCQKFVKKLKNAHNKNCLLVAYKKKRLMHEAVSSITIQYKILLKQSVLKAQEVVRYTVSFLLPQLMVKNCIDKANKYCYKIKFIQRIWKIKYRNRKSSLLYFLDNHVQKMVKQYPHFSLFVNEFYQNKANDRLIVDYLKDESQKYRFIYDSYLKKCQEIHQMIEMSKSKIKDPKSKLTVPKFPLKPMHRFYRNLDILRSMSRTWFEISYKKYVKKNEKYR